jgi:hypothetical protein
VRGFLRFYGSVALHESGPIHGAIFAKLLPREQTHVGADTGIGALIKIERTIDIRGRRSGDSSNPHPTRILDVWLAPPLGDVHLVGKRKQLAYTASFAAFTGRALTIFRAGLALNTVGSFVNGLMPARSFVAGFLMTTNFAKPGNRNAPVFFNSL